MPSIEKRNLKDYAVLWIASIKDNYGEFKVSTPIEIRVRWESLITASSDPQNTVETNTTDVLVDREIAIGSILWHGKLTNLPDTLTDLYKVSESDITPDLKNRFYQRSVRITKHSNELPTSI